MSRESDLADLDPIEAFPQKLIDAVEHHRPSRMPFFQRVRSSTFPAASDPDFLGDVH